MESQQTEQTPELQVEMVTPTQNFVLPAALCVETKLCSVNLTRLELILADDLFIVPPTTASDLPVGEHFTRSRSAPVNHHTGRKPQRANTGIKYNDMQDVADPSVPSKPKPQIDCCKTKQVRSITKQNGLTN